MIHLYADGGYNPARGQGGWGVVIVENSQKRSFSGVVKQTTGNRMEITAALEGIRHTTKEVEVTVYTDSQYLFGCMTQAWQRRANRDLWEEMDGAVKERQVRWEWIDQSQGNAYHKEAHNLATTAASEGRAVPYEYALAVAPEEPKLSHIDETGRPKMVDVSAKPDTQREAVARGSIRMQPGTFKLIQEGKVTKGDVLTTAQLAGIMAAKQTPYLIPLCHPLLISEVKVDFRPDEKESCIEVTATVRSTGKTGIEMEALTAVAIAALTVYDMCKAVDRGMRIENIRLVKKSGGKSGTILLEETRN